MQAPLFAYFGPETILPMTSIVAAIGGFLLMFGKNVLGIPARIFRLIVGKRPATNPETSTMTSPAPIATAAASPATEIDAPKSHE